MPPSPLSSAITAIIYKYYATFTPYQKAKIDILKGIP
jgi:hypothetical protein